MIITLLTDCATQQDFIDLYEEREVVELTNLCSELATTINTVKLQAGLDNAHGIINSRYLIAGDCGRALIKTSCKQIVLWITRYLLDGTKSRPMVNEDYQRAMELLDYACTECVDRCPLTREQVAAILGEEISTTSKLRCSSGNGNRFTGRFRTRIKVDRYGIRDGRYDELFLNDDLLK